MPWLRSSVVSTELGTGSLKLGQPVPLSNFRLETNSGWSQPAQANVPARFSKLRAQLPGASVPCWRMIAYCSGVSSLRHSASVWVTGYCLVAMTYSCMPFQGVFGRQGRNVTFFLCPVLRRSAARLPIGAQDRHDQFVPMHSAEVGAASRHALGLEADGFIGSPRALVIGEYAKPQAPHVRLGESQVDDLRQ